jgi:hypothetical protein
MTSEPASEFEGTANDSSILKRPIGKKKAKMTPKEVARDNLWKSKLTNTHTELVVNQKH